MGKNTLTVLFGIPLAILIILKMPSDNLFLVFVLVFVLFVLLQIVGSIIENSDEGKA